LAAQLATLISIIHESLNRAFMPWLFQKLKNNQWKEKVMIVRYTYLWLLFILLTTPLFFFIGPDLILLIAGSNYQDAGKVFGFLALGHSFGGMYAMLNCYIYFSKKTLNLSLITIFSGAINLILMLIWIPKYGINGAGYSFAASMFIRFFITWFIANKCHPMPWLFWKESVTR